MGPATRAPSQLALTAVGSHPPHTLTDTATVTGAADENADPANDATDTATIELTRGGTVSPSRSPSGQDPVVQVGQTVTYDITVTNTGDIDLATVPLADEFDSAVFAFTVDDRAELLDREHPRRGTTSARSLSVRPRPSRSR